MNKILDGDKCILRKGSSAKVLNIPQECGLMVLNVSSKGTTAKIGLKGDFVEASLNR